MIGIIITPVLAYRYNTNLKYILHHFGLPSISMDFEAAQKECR